MAIVENKLLLVLIGLTVVYIAYKLFFTVNKSSKLYEENLDKVMNSDEYKVKGRFE